MRKNPDDRFTSTALGRHNSRFTFKVTRDQKGDRRIIIERTYPTGEHHFLRIHESELADVLENLLAALQQIFPRPAQAPKKPHGSAKPNETSGYEPWTRAEEVKLLTAYHSGNSLTEIAKTHHRSRGAIQSRLRKLQELD